MRSTSPSIGTGEWLITYTLRSVHLFLSWFLLLDATAAIYKTILLPFIKILSCREVFEIYYRLLLTGFLVFIGQGLSVQIFFGIFVAFVYVKCQEIFTPYEDRQLNIFKMITLWQIFYIFFIALVSFTEVYDSDDWRFEVVVYLVVFGNLPLEFIIGYILPRLKSYSREKKVIFGEKLQERSDDSVL